MSSRAVTVAALASITACWAGCGKSNSNQDTTPEKVTEPAGGQAATPTPAKPEQAPPGNHVETPSHIEVAPPAKSSNDHAVYSFVDNRLSAHLTRSNGLVIPAGSAGFAKYVRLGNLMSGWKRTWELRKDEGGIKVARMTGKLATIYVPLSKEQAAKGSVRIRAFSKDKNTLTLKANDNKDINAKIESGWTTVELQVPSGQLRDGENALALMAKNSGVEVAWVQVGGDAAVGDDGSVAFFDGKSLVVPKGGAMSWYVMVPDKAKLAGTASCNVDVKATADDGTSAQGKLGGAVGTVDLSALAGKAIKLDLAAGCDAKLGELALVVPGPTPEIKRGEPPKHVVFMIMDALRADRVKAFNPKTRVESPNFDKLAESSAFYVQTYVQGNESQVSHASIWSSNYLVKHKAMEMKDILADKWTTIDEVAKSAGMYVVGNSGNGYIRPGRGFGKSWDKFANHIEKGLGLRGVEIVNQALKGVEPKKDAPWFAYMGLIDTHVTWRAKKPWIEKYDGGYKGRFSVEYGDDGPNGSDGKGLSDAEHQHVRALYDSNVSYQDDLVGQMIEKLKGWGVWDSTMLVITADHGDELWEDKDRVGHGASTHETLVHVPLIIHYPPMFPASKVTSGAEGIDIVPTIADALGVKADPEWQGKSLMAAANGVVGYPEMSFTSQYENFHAGRMGRWKVKLAGTNPPHLFDIEKDFEERNDLGGKASTDIAERTLIDPMWMLRQWNVEWKKAEWGNASDVTGKFAADMGE